MKILKKSRRNSAIYLVIISLLLLFPFLYGQTTIPYQNISSTSSFFSLKSGSLDQINQSTTGERRSIDENEYCVDSGDEFVVKIDIPGPEIKSINVIVSSDGYFLISETQGLYIRGLKLNEARAKIVSHLKKTFAEAMIECYLDKTHTVHITLRGALEMEHTQNLNSADRLFEFIGNIYSVYRQDSLLNLNLKTASLRNISLIRKDTVLNCDFLKFKATTNQELNPYLRENDVIYFSFKDTTGYTIEVGGMVGNPSIFEYQNGDNLSIALELAGGILPTADSTRIEVYRFHEQTDQLKVISLSLPDDNQFQLNPDDRIFIRRKASFHTKKFISIDGEVKFPGVYPIIEGKTKLSEVIQNAGGFTENASIKHSRLYRDLGVPGGRELSKLINTLPPSLSLNWVEGNFWRSAAKENLSIVTCDFEKLFIGKETEQDVTLKNFDKIVVTIKKVYVYVTGSVLYPGTVLFSEGWSYIDYIKAAGGFKERARPSRIKIIKHNTETWLDAKETVRVEPGDRIFVPQKDEKEPWDLFMQGLTVTTQILTIILVLRGTK